jgi:hypothetical protein
MFPKLDVSQIARLATFGQQRDAQPYEVILELGDLHHGIFVVLSGGIEVLLVGSFVGNPAKVDDRSILTSPAAFFH